jgi:hypothetical protein
MLQIDGIIKAVKRNGNVVISNSKESYLQPLLSTNECRDQIIYFLRQSLDRCLQETQRQAFEYSSYADGQESEKIKDIHEEILTLKKKFQASFVKKPYALNKAPIESIDKIQSMMNKFSAIVSMVLHQEISKFNKKESERIRKEMREMQIMLTEKYEKQL